MLEVWLPLIVIAIVGWFWHHVLRLREHVTAYARRLCTEHGVQLLDDSVGLHRIRVAKRNGSLHIVREYRFETSTGGDDRKTAGITLVGNRITTTSMPAEPRSGHVVHAPGPSSWHAPTQVTCTSDARSNVVPITRARRE